MANKKSNTKSKKAPAKKPTEEPSKEPEKKVEKKPEEKSGKKSRKPLIALLIVAAIALIGGIIAAVLCLNQPDPSDPKSSLSYSDSFFIFDNEKYTLWNANGERVTEEEFDNQSNFVNGYAVVKKDNQYGIIRENGSMAIEFGKYGNIAAKSGLFLAQDGNTKEYYLLTGAGKELASGSDLDVYTPSSFGGFAAVKIDDRIKIFNYSGALIKELDVKESASDPTLSSLHDYGLFHYGDKNILIDARDGSILAEFDDESRYVFDSVSDSRKAIIIENYGDGGKYKLYKDGKLYDLDETKYYAFTSLDDVIGYDNYSELALLDKDYKVVKKVSTYLDLKDSNNYAVENEDGNAEIYQNGEKIKDFGDDSSVAASGVLYDDYYAIETGDKSMFYRLDGSVGIEHEFKDISTLFDKFHHAIVADEDNAYYLIDTAGNKIGDKTYKTISQRDGGYELKDEDDKYAIANQNGEVMTESKYENVYYRSNAEPRNIWTGRNDANDFDVIDIEKGRVIVEHVNIDSFYINYFTAKNDDGKMDYYTYEGVKFYTSEKR